MQYRCTKNRAQNIVTLQTDNCNHTQVWLCAVHYSTLQYQAVRLAPFILAQLILRTHADPPMESNTAARFLESSNTAITKPRISCTVKQLNVRNGNNSAISASEHSRNFRKAAIRGQEGTHCTHNTLCVGSLRSTLRMKLGAEDTDTPVKSEPLHGAPAV